MSQIEQKKIESNIGGKQTVKNLVFNIVSFGINFIISFCFTPYLIRTVGKEAYSFFPLVNNLIGYSSIITSAVGSMAGRFITMRIYKNDSEGANYYFNSVYVANIFLSVLFTIVSVVCVVFITSLLTVPSELVTEVQWLWAIGCASLVIGLLTDIFGVGAFVKNRIDLNASLIMLKNLIRIFFIILLFSIFKPTIVFMSVSALIAAIVGVFYNLYLKRSLIPEITLSPRIYFSWKHLKEVTFSGIWNSVNQLSNILLHHVDLFITNIFIGAAATGDYSLVKTAPTLILNFLAVLSGTFVSKFNILFAQNKMQDLIDEVKKSMLIVSLLIGVPLGFLLVYSDVFFQLWVPGEDSRYLYLLTIWTIVPMICGGSVNTIFGVFTTTNKLKVPSLVLLTFGVLNTLVIYILLKTTDLGIWAIAIVGAVQSVIRNTFFTTIYGARCLNQKWTVFFPVLFKGILGMCMVVLISLFIRHYIEVSSWFSFFVVFVVIAVLSFSINIFVIVNKEYRRHLITAVKAKVNRFRNEA